MAISLSKNQTISLAKEAPALVNAMIGLGWDVSDDAAATGDFDLDASAFLMNGAVTVSDQHFIFYNKHVSPDGSVVYGGDNRTGEGEGDDETITIALNGVESAVNRIVITVTIHEAEKLNQNFGQVANSFMRLVNVDTGEEVARFDLGNEFSTETGVVFGELVRDGDSWSFTAIGEGVQGGLAELATRYGLQVS